MCGQRAFVFRLCWLFAGWIVFGPPVCGEHPISGTPSGVSEQIEARSLRFEPTWESLSMNPLPDWVKDAKFGVYTHWGVYSVPAHGGPDYIQNMYDKKDVKGKGAYKYHTEKFGGPGKFGYKDFIPLFQAEKFDADEWVRVMKDAGARFGGICLVHHDGFLLWDSKVSRWNSMRMGPKRDVYGEIAQAIRKADMKLLATFHHGRTFGYPYGNLKKNMDSITEKERETWDIFDKKYNDFYWSEAHSSVERFAGDWRAKLMEVIDKYSPDMIWFDGLRTSMRNNHPPESYVREAIAHYFNKAAREGREVAVCNKHAGEFNFPRSFGLLCYENGREMPADVGPWFLIDRAIAYPWCYVHGKRYRDDAGYHIDSLVDLVSRGGIFLLSLTPMGSGEIPPEEKKIMHDMGEWLKVNGEAIYGTRPWKVFAEGRSDLVVMKKTAKGDLKPGWDYRKEFSAADIRFTTKGNVLYAIALAWPEDGELLVRTLHSGRRLSTGGGIASVTMVGTGQALAWSRNAQGLKVSFPNKPHCDYAYAVKIEVKGNLIEE